MMFYLTIIVVIILLLQVPKYGARSCRRFISCCSFDGRKDKALDPFVFSFHPSSIEGFECYFVSETKVLSLTCSC